MIVDRAAIKAKNIIIVIEEITGADIIIVFMFDEVPIIVINKVLHKINLNNFIAETFRCMDKNIAQPSYPCTTEMLIASENKISPMP